MRRFFKKVLSTFIFLNAAIILTGVFAFLASRFLFLLKLADTTLYLIGCVPAIIIMLYIAYLSRWENKTMKQQYLEALTEKTYSFKNDFLSILNEKENIVHTLAFLSITFANSIVVAKSVNTPIIMFIVKVFVLLLIRGAAFYVLNTLIWSLVHRKWHKSRYCTK